MFNQYLAYTAQAREMSTACDDKILVDLSKLENMKYYDDIDEYVTQIFGEVEHSKQFEYPNDIIVLVEREPNSIIVGAVQGTKQIFGLKWKMPAEEQNNA